MTTIRPDDNDRNSIIMDQHSETCRSHEMESRIMSRPRTRPLSRRQPQQQYASKIIASLLSLVRLAAFCSSSSTHLMVDAAPNGFDPYQLNGGLVAAVAGRDFVVVACDTRLMGDGGYDILERHHLRSRLWAATPDSRSMMTGNDGDDSRRGGLSFLAPDGSIRLPEKQVPPAEENHDSSNYQEYTLATNDAPILVASAGCNADCEMLKRAIRSDLQRARYFSECSLASSPHCVATLLSHVLYSRRGFPFYSFCVVAGLSGSGGGGGQVYTYDAIGSYEQVAVATAGTGRELLQPILDRKFQSLVLRHDEMKAGQRDEDVSVAQMGELVASAIRPAPTAACSKMVSCSRETAVEILVQAFRDVSEREIGVGDQVVLCVLQRNADGPCEARVYGYPLKKH